MATEVPQDSGLTNPIDRPIGITVADRTRMLRSNVCTTGGELLEGFSILEGPPSGQFEATGSHLLMPGESVQLWGFFAGAPGRRDHRRRRNRRLWHGRADADHGLNALPTIRPKKCQECRARRSYL